jgi:hypothetical protein
LVVRALPARKVAGLTAILVAKTRRPAGRSVHLVDEAVKKKDQNILHADLPPAHVAKEVSGAKNQRQEKKDENY